MDPAKYKQVTTSRGLLYSYYFAPATEASKPTLLLLHGFPSTSADWAGLVPQFEAAGYGLIVPDMLGYRGTDKPTDPAAYVGSKLTRDLIDLLDVEGVKKAVAIGHDWGSFVTSRLAVFYPDRFDAFGFITVGYIPPNPNPDRQATAAKMVQLLGYFPWGYFPFMASEEGAAAVEAHMDSFMSLIFSSDVSIHKENICPPGAAQAWLERDTQHELLTSAWAQTRRNDLLKGGMAAPTCWYKIQVSGLTAADDAAVPLERYPLTKPVFFGACTHDAPSPPVLGDMTLQMLAKGPVTRHEYATGHWVMLTHYEALGTDLLAWLGGFDGASKL
ncbi:alpha/beta-hydrolase [Vararia minispora EC-137]|uniref:Alpha/beta-hydrolase n=1 Tax=Vararia minispora EC-137 TaxID=1314806 RepID=A0ACB8QZE4_9AGAM|nr:alpha/beta-hydrolase [Vararia minispora EC-137]